jgi:LacI family transcriptional regulator
MKRPYRIAIVWDFSSAYGQVAMGGVAAYCQQSGAFELPIRDQEDMPVDQIVRGRDIRGMLIYQQSNFFKWLRPDIAERLPVVSLETHYSTLTPWRVLPDDLAVGRMVAEELLRRGFRHLAYCSGSDAAWDRERRAGFVESAKEAGISPDIYHRRKEATGSYEREWRGRLADWLLKLPRPVGIMAAKDSRARHLLFAMQVAGIRVPEDAAVIGVGNHPSMALLGTGISSVELDAFRAGYAACQMLHKLMEGIAIRTPVVRVPPLRVITRRSSDVLAIDDLDVIQAVHFITENALRGIEVDDVVRAVPLSRRSLERRFHMALRCSILEKIRATQVERAKQLLTDKSINLRRIARLCGFTSAKSFGATFDRFVGISPSGYRAQTLVQPGKAEKSG